MWQSFLFHFIQKYAKNFQNNALYTLARFLFSWIAVIHLNDGTGHILSIWRTDWPVTAFTCGCDSPICQQGDHWLVRKPVTKHYHEISLAHAINNNMHPRLYERRCTSGFRSPIQAVHWCVSGPKTEVAYPIVTVSRITAFGASIWAGISPPVDPFCSITRHIVVFAPSLTQTPHSQPKDRTVMGGFQSFCCYRI